MTKAYEALVEFRGELALLANVRDAGQATLYAMRVRQLCAKYAWLQRIINNRLGTGYYLYNYASWLGRGKLLNVFEAIRGFAGVGSDKFGDDLERTSNLYLPNLRDVVMEHFGVSTVDDVNIQLERFGYGFAVDYEHRLFSRDDLGACERTGDIYCTDDLHEVVVSINSYGAVDGCEWWCERERERNAFYCEVSDRWYCATNFSETETSSGDGVCDEYMSAADHRHDYMWSERREIWVHSDNWETGYHDWEEEDEDDEDGGRSSAYMHGYHSAPKHHFAKRISLACASLRGFFGYELEMHFDSFDEREAFMRDVRNEGFGSDLVAFERDGSLGDDTASVEVITAPLSLDEVRASDGVLARLLFLAVENGAYVSEKCGTHVTSNTTRFLRAHRAQLLFAFYALRPLSVFVAQRVSNNYASFDRTEEKYAAINPRGDDLYEFRAFAGTLDHSEAASYAEYIEAIGEWTSDPSLPLFAHFRQTADPNTRAAFRAFVRSRSTKYPNLAARFCAPAPQLKETA